MSIGPFKRIRPIDHGAFGQVLEVEDDNCNRYALKKIWFIESELPDSHKQEIELMVKLKHKNIVKYYNHWFEGEFTHIVMELCKLNLESVLALKAKSFARTSKGAIGSSEYYISWHLVKEMAEGLDYLHSYKPNPIIHRDLKPKNILIGDGSDGSFVKLCDFGLSVPHLESSHSTNVGTADYMAPEVMATRHYNTSADMYSMSVIALEIMGFNKVKQWKKWKKWFDSDPVKVYNEPNTRVMMEIILEITMQCILYDPHTCHRLSCQEFLEQFKELEIQPSDNTEKLCTKNDDIFKRIYLVKSNESVTDKLAVTSTKIKSISKVSHKPLTNKAVKGLSRWSEFSKSLLSQIK